jgi:hypothetical protein
MSSTSGIIWRLSPRHAPHGFELKRGLPLPVALPLALLLTGIITAATALLVGRWT